MDKTEELQKPKRMKPTIAPFEKLENGKFEFGDSGEELSKLPPWFDIERAKRGQKFVHTSIYGVVMAHVLALMVIFTNNNIRNILIFTEKSETVKKAAIRYFATMAQVILWYYSEITEDLNSPFFTSIRNVRQAHKGVAFSLEKKMPDFNQPLIKDIEEEEQEKEKQKGGKKIVKRFWRVVKSDVESSFPLHSPALKQEKRKNKDSQQPTTSNQYYFSQYDMTIVQWSFCLVLHCPQKFGIVHATKEDYDDFLHLWAIIGHVLGIKPEYNLCLGSSMDEFQSYSKQIVDKIIFPGFLQLNYDAEVLWESMAKGLATELWIADYEFYLILLTESFLGVKPHNLKKLCSFQSKFRFFLWKYIFAPLLKNCSWLRRKFNEWIYDTLNKVVQKYFNVELNDFKKVSVCAFYPPKTS